jgi:uncharacterized FlaG/YvyC family protein
MLSSDKISSKNISMQDHVKYNKSKTKTKQNNKTKTKRNKTKQNKTKTKAKTQNKTKKRKKKEKKIKKHLQVSLNFRLKNYFRFIPDIESVVKHP